MDLYEKFYEVVSAESAEQLASAFRLRYQVYCVENSFEDPLQNPDGVERDAYDTGALHSLLVQRASGAVVGTVRLILPRDRGMDLPIRQICNHELLVRDCLVLPWRRTAEISRFAVSKRLCQRAMAVYARMRIPDPSLGLLQAVIAMAARSGVTHLCAIMEPALLRLLGRFGMRFQSLGPEVSYHGRRQPCYLHIDSTLARIWMTRRDVWALMTRNGTLWPLNTELVAHAGRMFGETQPCESAA